MAAPKANLILAVAAAAVLVVIGWRASDYLFSRDPCETLFQQTTSAIKSNVEFIKGKGEIVLAKQTVQQLDKGAQKLGLALRGCCVATGGQQGNVEFLKCQESVRNEAARITQIVTIVKEVQAAPEARRPQVAVQKSSEAAQLAAAVTQASTQLAQQVETMKPAATKVAVGAAGEPPPPEQAGVAIDGREQEPNNDKFMANQIKLSAKTRGEIAAQDPADWYEIAFDGKVRDWIDVRLQNRSDSYQPWLVVVDTRGTNVVDGWAPNSGADRDIAFVAMPGERYRVGVRGNGTGSYELEAVARKAADAFESNDKREQAKPITIGKPIEANKMDDADTDWYEVKSLPGTALKVRIETSSETLQPYVEIRDAMNQGKGSSWAANRGADLEIAVEKLEPGKDYLVIVGGNGSGNYRLTVTSAN